MSDSKFMRNAIRKAYEGVRKGQTPFGACIVKKGRVVAAAHNVVWKTCDITAHAEIKISVNQNIGYRVKSSIDKLAVSGQRKYRVKYRVKSSIDKLAVFL